MKLEVYHKLRIRALLLWYRLTYPYARWRASLAKPIEPNVKQGEKFILTEDKQTNGLTSWSAPFTGGFECNVPAGTVFEVLHDSVVTAKGFGCKPVNYNQFELAHVPESDRCSPKYNGYYFVLRKVILVVRLKKLHNKAVLSPSAGTAISLALHVSPKRGVKDSSHETNNIDRPSYSRCL